MKPAPIAHTYNPQVASVLLRIGLAVVLAYAAIDAFREPNAWISFIPSFSTKFIAAKTALDVISIVQLAVAAILLIGGYIKYAALVSFALLLGIVVFNLSTLVVTFRDIGLLFMSAALFFLDK